MDIPYGFDCFDFVKNEVKFYGSDVMDIKYPSPASYSDPLTGLLLNQSEQKNYVLFTRKNEDYTKEQLEALSLAGRLNSFDDFSRRKIFCGIKIQIGIGVVTNFLQTGLKYRPPIKGRSELVNGTWTGIVSGLVKNRDEPTSYDMAFGNFLAYDEEFPYVKFGPFYAIESKLVMLTGSSRAIEASSFGTNMNKEVLLTVGMLMVILSVLASFRVYWQHRKVKALDMLLSRLGNDEKPLKTNTPEDELEDRTIIGLAVDFFFIYITMLLNKPSVEFDNLIWPKHSHSEPQKKSTQSQLVGSKKRLPNYISHETDGSIYFSQPPRSASNKTNFQDDSKIVLKERRRNRRLPTSARVVSYLWSASCLVMVSIYSGEMLAVILLHADQNIDTISQLINSKPPIEPVIRQDDFTYNLMLKSLDENMLKLHNMTKIIPRTEVYTRKFIEDVSNRKKALLGDDELIETIYDIYHKYYPLYKSKVTYLQYPISIMYRYDLNKTLEDRLRRGIVQIFEMGLIGRWYQAQKETYIQWYDNYEKDISDNKRPISQVAAEPKYKPMSLRQFESFFRFMFLCLAFSFVVLALEILTSCIWPP